MAHEAKLGMVFIGILLTVFSALLIKKMTKHGNVPPPMSMNASTTKSPEAGSFSRLPLQPTPPTLVKPLSENTQPPEFTADTRDIPNQNKADVWSSAKSNPVKTETAGINSNSSAAAPPSLLAEPLPVAEVGSRYKEPVPYRSSYAATSEEPKPAPTVSARQEQPKQPVDPFPRINAVDVSPATDHAAENTAPPASYRQSNPPATTGVAETKSPPINSLRVAQSNAPSGFDARSTAGSNDRYTMPDSPPTVRQNPSPTYSYPPRASMPTEFMPSAAMSGVVPASAPPAPLQRNGDQYTCGPNDSFWTISQRAYGAGGYFKALFELNRKRTKDSEDLKVGEVLTVPDEAIIRRMYPDLCPKPRKLIAGTQQRMVAASNRLQGAAHVYTVVDGDTLFEIARHELGKPSRWAEIYDLNHDILGDDFDYLRPGTELILPDSSSGSSTLRGNTATRQPEAVYPR
jgi:nucleoid-associated protein YgaU